MDGPLRLARLWCGGRARSMRSVAVRLRLVEQTEFTCEAVEEGPSERDLQTFLQESHLGKYAHMRLK